MRLFIAIETSKEVCDYLFSLQDKFKTDEIDYGKFSFTKTFHLTLKFLGEVEDDKVDTIKEKLSGINLERFSLNLAKIGVFPDKHNPRVLWVGIKESRKVCDLQKIVDDKLSTMYEKDFSFSPHLTLARIKFLNNKCEFVKKFNSINIRKIEFGVDSLFLIKSILTKEGPSYEKLAEYRLS